MGVAIEGGLANPVTVTAPAITSGSAYSSGNALGAAFQIPNAMRPGGNGAGILQSILVVDASGQDAPIDFFIFKSQPTSGTDKAAYTLAAADYAKLLGVVSLVSYVSTGGAHVGQLLNIALPVQAADFATLFVQMVVRSGPTYTSVSAITPQFGLLQN